MIQYKPIAPIIESVLLLAAAAGADGVVPSSLQSVSMEEIETVLRTLPLAAAARSAGEPRFGFMLATSVRHELAVAVIDVLRGVGVDVLDAGAFACQGGRYRTTVGYDSIRRAVHKRMNPEVLAP